MLFSSSILSNSSWSSQPTGQMYLCTGWCTSLSLPPLRSRSLGDVLASPHSNTHPEKSWAHQYLPFQPAKQRLFAGVLLSAVNPPNFPLCAAPLIPTSTLSPTILLSFCSLCSLGRGWSAATRQAQQACVYLTVSVYPSHPPLFSWPWSVPRNKSQVVAWCQKRLGTKPLPRNSRAELSNVIIDLGSPSNSWN